MYAVRIPTHLIIASLLGVHTDQCVRASVCLCCEDPDRLDRVAEADFHKICTITDEALVCVHSKDSDGLFLVPQQISRDWHFY